MWKIRANQLLPKALKSCPKSNKSPNLVTLVGSRRRNHLVSGYHLINLGIVDARQHQKFWRKWVSGKGVLKVVFGSQPNQRVGLIEIFKALLLTLNNHGALQQKHCSRSRRIALNLIQLHSRDRQEDRLLKLLSPCDHWKDEILFVSSFYI